MPISFLMKHRIQHRADENVPDTYRIGSKVVITGDLTQKDLPKDTTSGLDVAMKVLSKVDEIGMVKLTSQDVVRHPLVQKIVKAYEEYESRMAKKQTRSKQARTRNGEKNDNKH